MLIVRTLVASCIFVVTVSDVEDPEIECHPPRAVANDDGLCSAVVTFTPIKVGDNCAIDTVERTSGMASGSAFPVGLTTNAYYANDTSGNFGNAIVFF
jgi:hypothetical protein